MFTKTLLAVVVAMLTFSPLTAWAAFPERSIQMFVPFAPGGGSDLIIRVVEKEFQQEFGQPLSFIYKPGASGAVGVSELKSIPADGYTLCSQSYPHIIIQELSGSGNFTIDDFDYLSMVAVDEVLFAVRKKSKFNTLEEFINAAKATPDTLSVATTDTLGCSHMAALKLKQLGVPVNIITYTGGAKAVAGLLGGQVDAIMVVKGAAAPSMTKMRFLGVCDTKRDPSLPDVPTLQESGYDIVQFNGRLIFAPKGLSADVRKRLQEGIIKIYSNPEVVEHAKKAGFDVRIADGDTVRKMFHDLRPEAEKLIEFSKTIK